MADALDPQSGDVFVTAEGTVAVIVDRFDLDPETLGDQVTVIIGGEAVSHETADVAGWKPWTP